MAHTAHSTRRTKRHYQRRTAAAWAQQQHQMARAAMAALWVIGAASLLGLALGSVAGGAWLAVQFGAAGW